LAAGISHNLNTPITIIQANAELLKIKNPDSPEIDKIMNQTKRMTGLITTILEKGKRDQETGYINLDLNELLKHELDFFNANLYYKHKVEKQFDFCENIPVFKAIYSDFSQSIMNIVQNAIDAMYNKPNRVLSIKTTKNESEIILTVSDTGSGISDEIKAKIFDPFFTTKPTNIEESKDIHQPRGTGLGLSLVYNLLMPYKVKIDFETEKDKGTTFILRIPIN
ncbi:MAG: HAMP domain-containing sensor histidine kinase, partial [Calditrichaceae bacterium]